MKLILKEQVICGFPGVGKTSFIKATSRGVDSDSSIFSWSAPGIRSKMWPLNYLQSIERNINKQEFVFVSTHKEVREGLFRRGIPYTLIYPDRSMKEEYIERYIKRGNHEDFIKLLENKWDVFLDEMEDDRAIIKKVLQSGEYLSDVIPEEKE